MTPALFTYGLGSQLLETFGLGGETPLAVDYTLAGPSTATTGILSDAFIVTLGAGLLPDPVEVRPSDGGAGGTFSPVSVTLSNGTRTAQFRYTPAAAGTVTISVTNRAAGCVD